MENVRSELLAPAGNLSTLICAVNAGADAVYVGGNMFSARAYAGNFSQEDLIKGIKYAHLHGVKVHLAVNTLFKNTEVSLLFDYLRPLVLAGLDAVIVQDIGVMSLIRRYFPLLDIHASTQCTVTDINGVRFFGSLGIKRVVLARELSIREISDIVKAAKTEGMETEVFIHGAYCYSYSGQCLMSSILGGRSGNRGRCAQPCRLPYKDASFKGDDNVKEKKNSDEKELYPLSLKDYNGAYNLDKMLATGVDSLKIEGRMKSPDYVYGVTKIYRKLIDEYYDSEILPSSEDIKALDDLGHRGGNTPGYPVIRNGMDMVTLFDASHRSGVTGEADTGIKRLKISGRMHIVLGEPLELSLSYGEVSVSVTGGQASPAIKAPVDEAYVRDKISSLGNTFFEFDDLEINMPEDPVFISAKELKELKRRAVDELEKSLLPERQEDTSIHDDIEISTDHRNTAGALEKHIVAESLSQIEIALSETDAGVFFICAYAMDEADAAKAIKMIRNRGIRAGVALPYVFREKRNGDKGTDPAETVRKYREYGAECFLVRNYGGIEALLSSGVVAGLIYTDHSVYTWNNETLAALRELGLQHFTAPLELNSKELFHRDNSNSTIVVSALYPLMVSAGCVHNTLKGCDASESEHVLTDRLGKRFKVKSYCRECLNVVYNSLPTDLTAHMGKIEELGFEAVRYDLTGMDDETVKAVFEGKLKETTGGHFKRGVE
ncbi:MAG: U32 family peptidase [Lachnospiraceae bacterium]|nr:U32 family peptidase [Lachnospiraceae bacterium]